MSEFFRRPVPWSCSQWVVLLLGGLVVGCAHGSRQAEPDELKRTVAHLRAQNAAYLKEISELQNEIFILRDRVETRQVAAQRKSRPVLPSVTLSPGDTPAGSSAPPARPLYDTEVITSPDGPVTVEYAGEAAVQSDRRPLLRLVGDRGGLSTEDEAFSSPLAERSGRSASRPLAQPVQVVGTGADRAAPRAPSAPPIALYRSALDQLSARAHADAAAGFREFLRLYPAHEYADNAQYWLGEVYYDLKDYATAAREFRRVVENHPDGNKVPDALLKLGYAYLALGEEALGRRALQELVQSFRDHPTARLAGARLADMRPRPDAVDAPAMVHSKETP